MFRYVLTTMAGANVADVVDASSRQLVQTLNKPSTASFKLSLSNELVPTLFTQDLMLKVYDSGVLRFHGPIVSAQATGSDSDRSVAIGAADPSWRFQYRLAGQAGGTPGGVLYTAQDKLTIANDLISVANGVSNTQITTTSQTCGSTATWYAGPYRPVNECIDDLAQSLGGFDWRILPKENDASAGTDLTGKVGTFDGAAVIGSSRPDVVLEWGGDLASLRSFDLQRDWTTLTNKSFHLLSNPVDTNYAVAATPDATSRAARGLFETVAEASDLVNLTLRQQLVAEHVNVRKTPRLVLAFAPDANPALARFGLDYAVGDSIHARVTIDGNRFLDGMVRVYQMTIDIDDNGLATYTPVTDATGAI